MKYLLIIIFSLITNYAVAQVNGQTISTLPKATALTGNETAPIVQNGVTVQAPLSTICNFVTPSGPGDIIEENGVPVLLENGVNLIEE